MAKSFKIMGALAVAGLIAAGGSAFTAANTVDPTSAGAGSSTVSQYNTTNIQYQKNAVDPQKLDSVTLTLDRPATYLAVRTHAGGVWYTNGDAVAAGPNSCISAGDLGTDWTCTVGSGETILGITTLDVVATA